MISIVKNHIDGVKVELIVDEEKSSNTVGGQPVLHITDKTQPYNRVCLVYDVDTLTVLKAVSTSNTLNEFKDKVKDTWTGKNLISELASAIKHKEIL